MVRNMRSDTNRDVLKRIVALLFALAKLADRTPARSYPVCLLVLLILRPAQRVAWNLVAGEAHALGASPRLPVSTAADGSDGRCEATRLALCFRLLALALRDLLAQAGKVRTRFNVPQTAPHSCKHSRSAGWVQQSGWVLQALDTS